MTTVASSAHSGTCPRRYARRLLWPVQALLAILFAATGVMKTTMPVSDLMQTMPWVGDLPPELVRTIGVVEIAGAAGLLVPAATCTAPALVPAAAAGLAAVMAGAIGFHLLRGELGSVPLPLILGVLAGFVAWGRAGRAVRRQRAS